MKLILLTGRTTYIEQHIDAFRFRHPEYDRHPWGEYDHINSCVRSEDEQDQLIQSLVDLPHPSVVGTHSDVIVNSARYAVWDGRLKPEELQIRHLHGDEFDDFTEVRVTGRGSWMDPVPVNTFPGTVSYHILMKMTRLKPKHDPPLPLTDEVVGECVRFVGPLNKIQAIKELRDRTGIGLKEAKDAVENWLLIHLRIG